MVPSSLAVRLVVEMLGESDLRDVFLNGSPAHINHTRPAVTAIVGVHMIIKRNRGSHCPQGSFLGRQ